MSCCLICSSHCCANDAISIPEGKLDSESIKLQLMSFRAAVMLFCDCLIVDSGIDWNELGIVKDNQSTEAVIVVVELPHQASNTRVHDATHNALCLYFML